MKIRNKEVFFAKGECGSRAARKGGMVPTPSAAAQHKYTAAQKAPPCESAHVSTAFKKRHYDNGLRRNEKLIAL
jgi:hypothetical protein